MTERTDQQRGMRKTHHITVTFPGNADVSVPGILVVPQIFLHIQGRADIAAATLFSMLLHPGNSVKFEVLRFSVSGDPVKRFGANKMIDQMVENGMVGIAG